MLRLGRQNLAVPYKMSCSYLKAKLSLENLFSKALCVFLLSLFASRVLSIIHQQSAPSFIL